MPVMRPGTGACSLLRRHLLRPGGARSQTAAERALHLLPRVVPRSQLSQPCWMCTQDNRQPSHALRQDPSPACQQRHTETLDHARTRIIITGVTSAPRRSPRCRGVHVCLRQRHPHAGPASLSSAACNEGASSLTGSLQLRGIAGSWAGAFPSGHGTAAGVSVARGDVAYELVRERALLLKVTHVKDRDAASLGQ